VELVDTRDLGSRAARCEGSSPFRPTKGKNMNIKEINSKKLFKEYLLEIPYDEVDSLINIKINEIMPTVSLPGFRKGKAPINIVRKKYENNFLNEVIQQISQDKIKNLLDEKKIKAFRSPKVELKKYEKDQPIELVVKIDIQPEIKMYPFDKIKSTKYKIEVDKETLQKNYNSFLSSQKIYEKISTNRSAILTDRIFVNITTEDSSVPDFLKEQKNIPIETESDYQVLPDISKKLIDEKVKVGDNKKLKFNLKEVLKEKEDKNILFNIEILSIEMRKEFKVDKEFLKKNNLKDEKELRKNIDDNIKNQYESYLREIEKKQLMDLLESKNDFDVPEGILNEEFEIIWHRVEHAKKDNKLDKDDQGLSDKKLKERYNKIALRRVKLAILMQHIAGENKISVSEKELTDGMLNYASQYPGQEKQIFDYFKKNPSSVESIRGPIFEKKIVDLILSKTKLETKKISVKDFNKLQEETFILGK
tara:strand:- start:3094 stop:4524 length:1431 start_codon:yes stop_codon:yes gene_type:complete